MIGTTSRTSIRIATELATGQSRLLKNSVHSTLPIISVPPAPQGQGWVDAAWVTASGADGVAVVATPPVPPIYVRLTLEAFENPASSCPWVMTWNGTGPYNPNIDALIFSEFLELSFHEVQVMNGLGVAIVTTPKGVMTDRKARQTGVGGEVLCYVA